MGLPISELFTDFWTGDDERDDKGDGEIDQEFRD